MAKIDNEGSVKILVCGGVKGQIKYLFSRVSKIIKTSGEFNYLFCVGDFFGDNLTEIKLLIDGSIKAPLPIYILSSLNENARLIINDPEGCSIAENVNFLGRRGLYSGMSGLRVVFAATENSLKASADDLDFQALHNDLKFNGVDILLTTEWPLGYSEYCEKVDNRLPSQDSCSISVSRLAYLIKPRYHFTSGQNIYFERRPYRNHRILIDKNSHITRFIGLAHVKNKENEKCMYALKIIPMSKMSIDELTFQPGNLTENPYTEFVKGGFKAKEIQVQTNEFFYDTKTKAGQKHSLVKSNELKDEISVKLARKQFADQCWFCLGNPNVEKHLIVSIGAQVYLALPRGPLVPEHILILTIGHHQSYLVCPPNVQNEIECYKKALKEYFKSRNQLSIFFERNLKTQHFMLQCIPIPYAIGGQVKNAFITRSETDHDSPCNLSSLPKNVNLEDVCKPGVPYFYLELPNGERLFNTISKAKINYSNIQFGRSVLASENLLNSLDRIDWKNCCDDVDTETNLTMKFRKDFLPFEPKTNS